MNKLVLVLTFIFSISSFAQSFLVYSPCKDLRSSLIDLYDAQEVFTRGEKTLLQEEGVQTNILRVDLNENELELFKLKLKSFPKARIEINPAQKLFATDPYKNLQWGLENTGQEIIQWESDIDATTVQGVVGEDISLGQYRERKDRTIKVAVIDSGIDIEHPDLEGQIIRKDGECRALAEFKKCMATNPDRKMCEQTLGSIDSDSNGYPLDCNGWNITDTTIEGAAVEGGPDIFDNDGHGTHVAGIIAAKHNDIGIQGIIQNAKIIPVQVGVKANSTGTKEAATDKIAKALLYAIKSGAQVINLSLGWRLDQDSTLMREMVDLALKKRILIVAAAGNEAHNDPVYPCSYEGVVCVGSHTITGELSTFSNYGSHVDISAPGERILSLWPRGKRSKYFTEEDNYEYLSGTSQASPHIAGVLARMLNLGFSPEQAKVKLLKGARDKVGTKSLLRSGNVDFSKSVSSIVDSFIYPSNKSPALSKWESSSDERSIVLKFKNLGRKSTNAFIRITTANENIEIINPAIGLGKMEPLQEESVRIYFNAPYDIDGEFIFKARITTDQEDKTYDIQAKALNLISSDSAGENVMAYDINGEFDLNASSIEVFENFTMDGKDDLLAVRNNESSLSLSLLKEADNSYTQSKWINLNFESALILNLSKVDVDLNGKANYVITLIGLKDKDRKAKFFVFDENFSPTRLLIAPEGTFDNKIATLPGSFSWSRFENKMVPAWIGVGEIPQSQIPSTGPWEEPKPNPRINHLYLLTSKGLIAIEFEGQETLPLSLLYTDQESKSNGELILIAGDSYGYYKNYSLYSFKDSLNKLKDFKLWPYMDLVNARPLPMANTKGSNAFFFEPSLGGARVVGVEYKDSELNITHSRVDSANKDKVQRVLSFDGTNAIAQTSYGLTSANKVYPSKVKLRRIEHNILKSVPGLYLSSRNSPGLSGELLLLNETGEFVRPANWFNLGVNDCSETAVSNNGLDEHLIYSCLETGKIIKMKFKK